MSSYDVRNMSLEELKALVLKTLKEHQATSALVVYCGAGDSGQIDHVEIEGGNTEGVTLPVERPRSMYWEDTQWVETTETVYITVEYLLGDLAYKILEESVGGWELNDGSAGQIKIDVATGKITLNHEWFEMHTVGYDKEM